MPPGKKRTKNEKKIMEKSSGSRNGIDDVYRSSVSCAGRTDTAYYNTRRDECRIF